MKTCRYWGVLVALFVGLPPLNAADPAKLAAVDKPPSALSEKLRASLDSVGQTVQVKDKPVCTIWIAKQLPVKADFKPSLSVKYPLNNGQLIGVLEVAPKSEFTDFRGQEIAPGLYTLRYGQQPVDGNHVGTSELSDFLLAIPVNSDEDPAPQPNVPALFKLSAKATGSNHPAIFSLLPPKTSEKAPSAQRDSSNDFLILNLAAGGKSGDQVVPLRLIIIGRSEG